MSCRVLVLSQEADYPAVAVAKELQRRGVAVTWFDTSRFPADATLVATTGVGRWTMSVQVDGSTLDLNEVTSVWYRRPGRLNVVPTVSEHERSFALEEARMGLGGLLRTLDCLWVNHPEKLVTAEYKPLQLEIARETGWRIPKSLLTNDPAQAIAFCAECRDHVVYKPLSGGDLPVDENQCPRVVYTNMVNKEQLSRLGSAIAVTPCLFQEYIPKRSELRLTVIGDEVFPVEIESQRHQESSVDWRQGYQHLRYNIYSLPQTVRESCVRLVRQLGLHFAAIDAVITPDGDYVFLEVNANGQWLWLEFETGLPMVDAMADLLSRC